MDYKKAGVDIEAGYKSVELMKQHIAKTMRPEVLGGIGGFSGAFSMNSFKDMEEPTLVSGTDGVGTKLKLAFIMDKHDTVGIDCVAMCVNDIACAGGEPLFFLDYIACGKNEPEKIAKIVKQKKTGKPYAVIQGVKKGKTTLLARYKHGKKIRKLTCRITVLAAKKATPQKNVAVPSSTASPSQAPNRAPAITLTPVPTATPTPTWVTTWGTAEEKCDVTSNAMPQIALEDSTVRQVIKVTTTGSKIRFRLSNQYGGRDVTIKSMHIAKQVKASNPEINTDTDATVTFEGKENFIIPKGKVIQTDAIDFPVEALENVAISTFFGETPTTNITGHRGARATTYQVSGNQVSANTFSNYKKTTSWFFLADASLLSANGSKAVVCFGDSITDGYGTDATYLGKKPDSYTRWGDYFAKRLKANKGTENVSVINEGIGSNSILGSYPTDAGKDRFNRDLLEHDGVAYCIILFGVNDLDKLQNTDKYNLLLPEYQKMIETCHKNNIKVYGAPILPFGTSSFYSENSEKVRQLINQWMRSSESGVDGIIDFENAVADPANPQNLLAKYTNKDDGIHPYNGYQVMANAIDLNLFQ